MSYFLQSLMWCWHEPFSLDHIVPNVVLHIIQPSSSLCPAKYIEACVLKSTLNYPFKNEVCGE